MVYIGASGDEYDDPLILTDHWEEQEVDNLRQDLVEAEACQHRAEMIAASAEVEKEKWARKFTEVNEHINEKVDERNGLLREKSMIYLDLIYEYEMVLDQYASNSQVKLTTTKINELRKRGGLQV